MWSTSESADVVCLGVLLKQPVSSSIDSPISTFILTNSIHVNSTSLPEGGFILLGDTLIMLRSSLDSEGFGGSKMSAEECLNSALVGLELPPLRDLVLDEFSPTCPKYPELVFRGRILSSESQLLLWRPSDTPAILVKRPPRPAVTAPEPEALPVPAGPAGQPDWLTRRADTGALGEFFIFNYLREAYGPSFPLSAWVSSAKRRFFPEDRSRVNDALGADFEFQDTQGVFSKNKGVLLRLEVKGTVRSTFTQFEISRNELKGLASSEGGAEYAIALVANVSSEFRPPNVYAIIRDMHSLLDLQPIQFVAYFDLHAPKQRRAAEWYDSLVRGSLPVPVPVSVPVSIPVEEEKPVDPDTIEANFFEDMEGHPRKRPTPDNPNRIVFDSDSDEVAPPRKKRKDPLLTKSAWYR